MKKKIKNFFLRRRFKVLKNKKGFSLLEVLVAVGIIGIISAIAYPAFDDYRKTAAKTAADTSATNMIKAFKNCNVLKPFTSCNTLGLLNINCPANSTCEDGKNETTGKFCASIETGTGDNAFKVCVALTTAGGQSKKYGGGLLGDRICYFTEKQKSGQNAACPDAGDLHSVSGANACTSDAACTAAGGYSATDAAKCELDAYKCEVPSTSGNCGASTGECT